MSGPGMDLAEIRERAEAHQRDIEARTVWYTPAQLAARWQVSQTTVRDIPRDELPWIPLGRGLKKQHRRYSPEAVAAYEARAMPKGRAA